MARNITQLILSLTLLICNSCCIFGLDRIDTFDLEADFYIENKTDYPLGFFMPFFSKGIDTPLFIRDIAITIDEKVGFAQWCQSFSTTPVDELFQYYVVGDIREESYVQITNLSDSSKVAKWYAKDTSQGYFYDISNWRIENSVEGKMTYRKYTLTLTNEIFDSVQ